MGARRSLTVFLAVLALVVTAASPTGAGEPTGEVMVAAAAEAVPVLVVEPATGLVDGQSVTVTATGFETQLLLVSLCPVGALDMSSCHADSGLFLTPDDDGAFSRTTELPAVIRAWTGGTPVDCRSSACELVVFDQEGDAGILARAAVAFDPDGPLIPPPVLAAQPSAGLVDGQTITVSGTGFRSGAWTSVQFCAVGDFGRACRTVAGLAADEGGSIAGDVTARALLHAWSGAGTVTVDCRTNPTCHLVAEPQGAAPSNEVPLDFDPDAELLPPPTLEVDPDTELVDGQPVGITAGGFAPDDELEVSHCAYDSEGVQVGCRWLDFQVVDADGSASWQTTLRTTVPAWASGEDALDCRAVTCRYEVTSSVSGDRAAVDLHFDLDGDLWPAPEVTSDPSGPLIEGEQLSVSGRWFTPGTSLWIRVCASGTDDCDYDSGRHVTVDGDGSFETTIRPYAAFAGWDGGAVDCRFAPGCDLVVSGGMSNEAVQLPIEFDVPPASRGRYLDPVFDEVEVIHDVVYRTAVDVYGNTVDLKMDIYQPAGDTAAQRPVIMWMHGGWFAFGSKEGMADYARESASRGYVAISLQYRLRPEVGSHDLPGTVEAAYDAYDDAVAAVEWIVDNAPTYRIDPRAIMVGGYSAGGVLSWNLSYWADAGDPDRPAVAGAAPIAGIPFVGPEPGDPPIIGFHATDDLTVPVQTGRERCAEAVAMSVVCEWIEYSSGGHGIVSIEFRDIVRRSHDFFHQQVLVPLGYAPPAAPPARPIRPRTPGGPVAPTTSVPGPGPSVTTTTQPSPTTPTTGGPSTTATSTVPGGPTGSTSQPNAGPIPSSTTAAAGAPAGRGPVVAGTGGAAPARPARPVSGRPAYTG